MKIYFTFTRRRMILIFSVVLLVLLMWFSFLNAKPYSNAETNEQRLEYITDLGYSVKEEPIYIKCVIIPSEFNVFYSKYNSIQKKSGYDLSTYKGCSVMLYGYRLIESKENYSIINIMVYNGRVIGGDVQNGNTTLPLNNINV